MSTAGAIASDTTLSRVVDLNGTNFRKGATAPTDVTIGTLPSVPALLFDAVLELASTTWRVPLDWDSSTDPVLLLRWSLVNGQGNNDVANITIDYTVSVALTTASGPDKTSTQRLGTTTVTTGNGLAINDVYETAISFPRGDANNPIAPGDLLHLEMHLTNVTGVAAIHLLDAAIRYEAAY